MGQLPLFASLPTVLVEGEHGRIDYTPGFVDPDTARAWFLALRAGLPWKAERRQMYDREVDVPRLTAHLPLAGDRARGELPEPVAEAARRVTQSLRVPFNSVGFNCYRDGNDSVAPHNDHLHVLVPGFPIALLSLGSPRRMTIRQKAPPRRSLHVELEPGSLLVMSYETQLHYTHGVPKTKEPVGERISLAFRVKPAEVAGRDPYADEE